MFRLKELQLGQTMHVSEEIDIIGSDMHVPLEIVATDHARFSCNTLSWFKLSTLHSGQLKLAQKTLVAFELDCKGFS